MTDEQAVYGKSYGEIVVHAFRKNWAARIALAASGLMVAVSVLAPFVANDRPLVFTGTMPAAYQKAFNHVTRGATLSIIRLPQNMAAERKRFDDKTATLNDYIKRMTEDENTEQYDALSRLRKRAESRPDTRGPWISRDVPLADVEEEMRLEQKEYPKDIEQLRADLAGASITPEQRKQKRVRVEELEKAVAALPHDLSRLESARQRIMRDMPRVYEEILANSLRGIGLKLSEMADQTEGRNAKAAEIEARFRAAVAGTYVANAEDRRPQIEAAAAAARTEFDPEKTPLVPRTRWPLVSSLGFLDIFFVTALVLAAIGFGPLTWWRLKRIAPIERRWRLTWALALAPAAVLSLAWLAVHKPKFDTVSYKAGVADGTIVMSSALWPPLRYRYDEVPVLTIVKHEDRPPHRPSAGHWFGTDFMGRDLLSRMIWGSRISLSIGFVSTAIALTIGIVLGALAGYFRGWVDMVIQRVIETMMCFPTFFLILAVVAFLSPNIYNVMVVLGIFGWMGIARLQRGEFLRLVNQDFVQSAIALGAPQRRVIFSHILPNGLAPVLVAASFSIAGAMLTESGLSFLGFGVQEPDTSWGQILYTGRASALRGFGEWWVFVIPGAAIFLAVTCYNIVGDGVRDAVDPRLKT